MKYKKHSHIPASPTQVQQPDVNYTTLSEQSSTLLNSHKPELLKK